jgi:DNA-binding transcriptional LysR family regulator
MELRHLRYFLAVAEELNFTQAAERVHIGQPPLSMQIRDLEDELGVKLFERTKRRVRLTEEGDRFLIRARAILADVDAAAEEMRCLARGDTGRLRLGFAPSLPYTSMLPDLLYAYRQRFPDVELQLSEMFTNDQLEALVKGNLDAGLVRYVDGAVPDGIKVREIGRDSLCIAVNVAHPLAQRDSIRFSQLVGERFITYPPGVGTGLPVLLRQACRAAGFEPRIVQVAQEATTQIGLVAAGLGIALLPSPLECIRIPRIRYLPIADTNVFLPLSVAVRGNDARPLLLELLNLLEQTNDRMH